MCCVAWQMCVSSHTVTQCGLAYLDLLLHAHQVIGAAHRSEGVHLLHASGGAVHLARQRQVLQTTGAVLPAGDGEQAAAMRKVKRGPSPRWGCASRWHMVVSNVRGLTASV